MRKDWKETTLGEVATITNGGTPSTKKPEFWGGEIPWITTTELTEFDGKRVSTSVRTITATGVANGAAKEVRPGTTLLGTTATIGTTALTQSTLCFNQQISGLTPKAKTLLDQFLFVWARGSSAKFEELAAGTSFKRISTSNLRNVTISLPPLSEQRRIVDVIESVDTYIDALQKRADTARNARSALLHELLSAGGEDWKATTLGEVAEMYMGRTPPRAVGRYWTPDLTYPFCTIADMDGKLIEPNREGVTQAAIDDGKARKVKKGMLMMSFKLTLGRVGFAAIDLYPNEAIVAITPNPDLAMLEFLFLWLGSQNLSGGSGRAVKGETLNSKSLALIPVTLPPLAEQRRIVDIIESVDSTVTTAEDAVVNARSLRSALLSDLLSGDHEIPKSYDKFLGAA